MCSGKIQARLDVLAPALLCELPDEVAVAHGRTVCDGEAAKFGWPQAESLSCFEVKANPRTPIALAVATHCETFKVAGSGANLVGSSSVVYVSIE